VVDISHPQFEDHIESVNAILKEIKCSDKRHIMVFNKIDAFTHETIEEDDLMTERTKAHYSLEDWRNTWMNQIGDKALFISAINKENMESFRKRVYKEVRDIHVTRFPYNNFLYPEEYEEYAKNNDE